MSPIQTVLYVLGCTALCAVLVACASDAQVRAGSELSTAIGEATADGVVTPEEETAIREKIEAVKDAPGIDWETVGAALLATAAGAFPALRLLLAWIPNRHILGDSPDPEVARAAGVPGAAG
jgi:hypothetical protein